MMYHGSLLPHVYFLFLFMCCGVLGFTNATIAVVCLHTLCGTLETSLLVGGLSGSKCPDGPHGGTSGVGTGVGTIASVGSRVARRRSNGHTTVVVCVGGGGASVGAPWWWLMSGAVACTELYSSYFWWLDAHYAISYPLCHR